MKKVLIAVGIVVTILLSVGGYFGKKYFDEHYVILNEQEMMSIDQAVKGLAMQAYVAGQASCSKGKSFNGL